MKKLLIGLGILFIIIIVIGLTLASSTPNEYKNIKAEELNAFIEANPTYNYIDVRTKQEYNSGHIEGFENIEDTQILAGNFLLDVNNPIVLICRSGNRSSNVAKYLTNLGYSVINVEDGIINYEGELK